MDKGHRYFEGIDMRFHTALQNNSAGGIYIPTYWAIAPYPTKYYLLRTQSKSLIRRQVKLDVIFICISLITRDSAHF